MSMTPTALIKALVEVVRLSWQIQLGLFFSSLIVVVFSHSCSDTLGITELVSTIRPYCFVLALVTFMLLIVSLAELTGQHLIAARGYMRVLKNLSNDEREVLRTYINGNTKTRSFGISDGVATGLVSIGVLYRPSNLSHPDSLSFPYNIQPWAWVRLKKHPELLRIESDRSQETVQDSG